MTGTWRGPSSATFSIVEARYERNYEALKTHETCGPRISTCPMYGNSWTLGFIVKEISSGDCVMSLHCDTAGGSQIVTQDFTCTSCEAGKYSSATGASSSTTCTACEAGKYSSESGASGVCLLRCLLLSALHSLQTYNTQVCACMHAGCAHVPMDCSPRSCGRCVGGLQTLLQHLLPSRC
jgi:hypothetical protein